MPSLGGATGWLNSEPLGPAELRGHVVLVDFWTLTCINWLRTEPYIRAWSQAYRDDGLIVIGVHTPEFSFEHEIDRVRQATKERAIDYPVALDNDYEIWSAFDNHYWPALYFVDADGVIRDHHFGEGRYEQSERVIQRLLGVERELVSVEGLGVEAEADWDHLRHARDVSRLRPQRALRVTGAPPTTAPTTPRAPALQPLGPRRRVDDRARERRARPARREHRLPLPRARRAPRAVARRARADPLPRAPRRRGSGPVTRRGRRRGRERLAPRRPAVPARARSTTRSASGRWRSRSSSPAPRRTCSRSASDPDHEPTEVNTMRPDIAPGATFPDYELPDHENVARKLSDIQGDDPMILTLARGHYCPKEHQQHLDLAANYPKINVAYTKIATIATDEHHTLQEFRNSVGAQWPFLSDPERTVQKDLDIQEYTDPDNDPMIPHTLVLKPGLVVHKIYNGYWFWGRPSFVDLWHDLRDADSQTLPDWDLSSPGLRQAWDAGDLSPFHGWNKRSRRPDAAEPAGETA